MNITITVDEITLQTVVAKTVAYDEDGDVYETGEKTVGHLVAEQIVDRLVQDKGWPNLRQQVNEIRAEEIRAQVRPSIEIALTKPIRKTNSYGEPIGQETTLSELIVDEVRKQLAEPADRYRTEKGTLLQQAVRAEVKKALGAEITDAVQQVRKAVLEQVSATASEQITAAAQAVLKPNR